MNNIRKIKKFLPLVAILFLAGCSLWNNFTTYFNLYFNTKQLYEEALTTIQDKNTDPFILDEEPASGNLKTILDDLQEKASRILQHESESAFVDDALFMSGFAFYYSGNYIKANRKFQELASLEKEEFELKSRLWIGKCELQMRDFESGMEILENVRDSALAREDEEVLDETFRMIIAYHIDRKNHDKAISEGYKLIETSENDELKAQTAYRIGLLHLENNREEEAAEAFQLVLDFSPSFEVEFQSKFELAKLKKELGQTDESLEMLEDLYNEGKYSAYWGDVLFQIGLIEYEAENYDQAFTIFQDVNELYEKSLGAVQSKLMLGEIMRNVYADYDSAKTYYDAVKSNTLDPEIQELANVYSESITTYMNLKTDIHQRERQIVYLDNPEEFLRDSVAFQRYVATLQQETEPAGTIPGIVDTLASVDTTSVTDTTQVSSQDSLFANIDMNLEFDDDYIVKEKPVYPQIGEDSLEAMIAKDFFSLGNLFFTDLIKPDSAYHYYNLLLDEFPETQFKPRVLFALGAYWESKGDTVKSDSLFSIVYTDYKTHPIANEAADKLDKPPLITESDPAKEEYLFAESEIEDSNYTAALTKLIEITEKYPESIYVPKSLYTIGWLYENKTEQPDSAASYYSQLMDEYKNSEYASAVRSKVTTYQFEIKKIEEEKKKNETAAADTTLSQTTDSLRVAEPELNQTDSLNTSQLPDTTISQTSDSLRASEPVLKRPDSLNTSQPADTTQINNN